jgi:AcrR family transcriptional regulator
MLATNELESFHGVPRMAVTHRAIRAEDKAARRTEILDAAARLLREDPGRVANVADVARAAGVAKGTVYLYFPGKEDLLLALHERNVERFFDALCARLATLEPLPADAVLAVVRAHVVDDALFLPLAARCLGVMQQAIEPELVAAFRGRMAKRLERAGAALERHFAMAAGDGVTLLRRSFALIVGLWQLAPAAARGMASRDEPDGPRFSLAAEVDAALSTLWRGAMTPTSRRG